MLLSFKHTELQNWYTGLPAECAVKFRAMQRAHLVNTFEGKVTSLATCPRQSL